MVKIEISFFQYVVRGRDGPWDSIFWWNDVQEEGKVQTFWRRSPYPKKGAPPPQFPPWVGHLDLSIRKTLRRVVGLPTVMILKRVSESIFSKQQIYSI